MKVIGKEFVRDELVYVPTRMFVRKHYVEKTRCVSCGIDENRDNEREDDIPKQVFGRGNVPVALIPGNFCSPERTRQTFLHNKASPRRTKSARAFM